MSETHWMEEEYGIPHKNGMVRFDVVSYEEDTFGYLGWFDMTDWDKGWEHVRKAAEKRCPNVESIQVLRHDQLVDLLHNAQWALMEALEDKDETTAHWWYDKSMENAKC